MRKWGGKVAARLVRATLATYGTECHLCNEPGATSADHLIPRSRGGPDTLDNLRPVHLACNQRRGDMTLAEYRARYGSARQGVTVRVVVGPPAGGKSTYVDQHARSDDVVIDLDALANALRPAHVPTSHAYPRHVRSVAIAARLGAIREAARLRRPITVWLINTMPTAEQLATYAADGWEVITVDPGREIARARAIAAGRPDHAVQAVDTWYDTRPTLPASAAPPRETTPVALAPSRDWFGDNDNG